MNLYGTLTLLALLHKLRYNFMRVDTFQAVSSRIINTFDYPTIGIILEN